MNCKFQEEGNPRWCKTIWGECQFQDADFGEKCPIYDAFPNGETVDPPVKEEK
jgi:hypothetical protein